MKNLKNKSMCHSEGAKRPKNLKKRFFAPSRKRDPVYWTGLRMTFMIVLLSSSIVFAADEALKFPFIGKPNRDDVNIRAGNDQNFEILAKVNTDDLLFITEQSYGWVKVRLPNFAHCYVAKDFIEKSGKEAVSKVSNLNVRARPNKESSIIGQLKKGDAVTVLAETEDGWYEILPPLSFCGWVRSDFIEFYSYDEKIEEVKPEGAEPAQEPQPLEKPKKRRFLWW